MFIRPLIVALLVSLSGTALAQSPPPGQTGLYLGARLGYGIPGGKVGSDGGGDNTVSGNLSEGFTGMVPLALEVGYRVLPHLSLGATFQYGFAFINKDNAKDCGDCSGHDLSFGANVYLHAAPFTSADPWIGLGVGYESLGWGGSTNELGSPASVSASLSGLQFLNLQLGLDFAASPQVTLGPYVGVAMGKYDSVSATATFQGQTMSASADITNTAVHEWFTLGVRGGFNL